MCGLEYQCVTIIHTTVHIHNISQVQQSTAQQDTAQQSSTVQQSTAQYSTVQYSAVRWSADQHNSTVLYCDVTVPSLQVPLSLQI